MKPMYYLGAVLFFFTGFVQAQHISDNMSFDVDTAWVRHYAPGLLSGADRAYDIHIDGAGNIYISGYDDDYRSFKYDPSGNTLWTIAGRVSAIDNADNVYIHLASESGLAKFDPSGNEQWSVPVSGDLSIDETGNAYVYARRDSSLYRYNSSGILQFQWPIVDCLHYAVDGKGNVFIAGVDSTYKYTALGEKQWSVCRNHNSQYDDPPRAGFIDTNGNVLEVGSSWQWGTYLDFYMLKFDSLGTEQWFVRYDGPAHLRDYIGFREVDQKGNIYIAGRSGVGGDSQNTDYDYVTLKYSPDGQKRWEAYYEGPGHSTDQANDIYVDDLGFVYVTGKSGGGYTNFDFGTIKYDASGAEQWSQNYGDIDSEEGGYSVQQTNDGGYIFTGYTDGYGVIDWDIYIVKTFGLFPKYIILFLNSENLAS